MFARVLPQPPASPQPWRLPKYTRAADSIP